MAVAPGATAIREHRQIFSIRDEVAETTAHFISVKMRKLLHAEAILR
jgi:hypothetical protein